MRLTLEEHPQAVKRYAHVKPARGAATKVCAATCPGTAYTCTRGKGHRGPHVAHASFRKVRAVWDSGAPSRAHSREAARISRERARSGQLTKRPVGLPTTTPAGVLEALKSALASTLSSWDQVAFVVLFIVFVKLAIDVLSSLG